MEPFPLGFCPVPSIRGWEVEQTPLKVRGLFTTSPGPGAGTLAMVGKGRPGPTS
jgi:hypothetical protein